MKKVEKKTFVKQGTKEVIQFITVPRLTQTLEEAESALNDAVQAYTNDCNQGFNVYYAKDNPFSIMVVHGMND